MTTKTSRVAKATKTSPKAKWPEKRAVVNMRFDPALLARLDEEAKRRGVNRTAWIHWAVSELLDSKRRV